MSLSLNKIEKFIDKNLKTCWLLIFTNSAFSGFSIIKSLTNDGNQTRIFSELFILTLSILSLISVSLYVIKSQKNINLTKARLKTKNKLQKDLLFFAAIFLPANIRETLLGDMEEIYKKDVKRFGVKKAKWLMFKDIVVSNYPIMKEFARKSAIKIIKFAGVYEAVRRIIG
jgi:hypothetical protein